LEEDDVDLDKGFLGKKNVLIKKEKAKNYDDDYGDVNGYDDDDDDDVDESVNNYEDDECIRKNDKDDGSNEEETDNNV
jgi:hypothetical protein